MESVAVDAYDSNVYISGPNLQKEQQYVDKLGKARLIHTHALSEPCQDHIHTVLMPHAEAKLVRVVTLK